MTTSEPTRTSSGRSNIRYSLPLDRTTSSSTVSRRVPVDDTPSTVSRRVPVSEMPPLSVDLTTPSEPPVRELSRSRALSVSSSSLNPATTPAAPPIRRSVQPTRTVDELVPPVRRSVQPTRTVDELVPPIRRSVQPTRTVDELVPPIRRSVQPTRTVDELVPPIRRSVQPTRDEASSVSNPPSTVPVRRVVQSAGEDLTVPVRRPAHSDRTTLVRRVVQPTLTDVVRVPATTKSAFSPVSTRSARKASTPRSSRDRVEPESTVLEEGQQEHVDFFKQLLTNPLPGMSGEWFSCQDTSDTGAGKTRMAIQLALDLSLALFVVCPAHMQEKWADQMAQFGASWAEIISYEKLRGVKGRVTHQYLDRLGATDGYYIASNALIAMMMKQPILFVFDEVQATKNPATAQLDACTALVRAVASNPQLGCKVATLGALPGDKLTNIYPIFRMCGIATELTPKSKELTGETGLEQVLNFCLTVNPETTAELIGDSDVNKIKSNELPVLFFELYSNVVRPLISSACVRPQTGYEPYIANCFYRVQPDQREAIASAMAMLSSASSYILDPKTNEGSMAELTKAMMALEIAKAPIIARVADKQLREQPNCKVIVFVNYHSVIDLLCEKLKAYNPIVMHGNIKHEKRNQLIELFNQPNKDYRLMITNTAVAATGIDLDDISGDYPRWCYIIPTFSFISMLQAAGRAYRVHTSRSRANVRFFFAKLVGEEEGRILDAIHRKKEVAKELRNMIQRDSLLPGEYPIEYEE